MVSAFTAAAVLMMISPGSSWGPSHTVQQVHRFESIEHCEHAAKMYRLHLPKAQFFCIDGALPQ